jgi:hypothetical protein
MPNTILYEDEHLVCIEQSGTRDDIVIVTFSEMLMRPHADQRIWAGTPLQKLGYASIGFVAKASNWFPQASVEKVAKVVRARLETYPARIGYGFSMGGWAVLHYAKMFDLNVSIAFSPQYSINSDEVADRRFSPHFDPVLHKNVAITKDKGAQFNLVIWDPYDRGDHESAVKIASSIETMLVPLAFVGHGSVRCVTSPQTLGDLLSATVAHNHVEIRRILNATRRNAPARAVNLAHTIAQRKPHIAFSIYCKYSDSFPANHRAAFFYKFRKTCYREKCFEELNQMYEAQKEVNGFLPVFALFLKEMGRLDEAKKYIARAVELHDTPNNRFIAKQINC